MFKIFEKKRVEDDVDVQIGESASFEKTIINTQNLADDIKSIATKYNLKVNELDFRLLSFKTFYTKEGDSTLTEITELNRSDIITEENLRNPSVKIFQELRVELFKKEGKRTFPLSISIGANRDFTLVKATIKAKEKISYFEGLDHEIISEIDKKKARLGLLIGLMDDSMRSGVKKLVSIIRVNEKLGQNTSFNICEGFKPVETISQELIEHYKNRCDDKNMTMHGISEGDLVIEIIKPKEGAYGRDCKGGLLAIDEIELSDKNIEVSMSEDFEIKEDEEKIQYFAKKSGYIYVGIGNRYEIKDEFIVDSVSLKTTGDIDMGEDSEVTVTIQEQDSALDAVGPGVELDTNELNIAGSIANNAKIKANRAQIKGQTHQSSTVEAKEIQIHLHKGYAEGEEIEIDILEGGVVVGDIVRVEQFLGGEIRAKEVYIKEVTSNSKVYASHHIEIEKITGNGNLFTVDALAQRNFYKIYDEISEELKTLEIKLKKLPKELKYKKISIDREKENIVQINKSIEEMKKFGRQPLASLVMKLKDHQEKIKVFNSLLKELKDAKLRRDSLHEELTELNTSVLKAKVINHSPWREFNEVVFKLIEPPIEVSFLPKEGEVIKELTLRSSDEGEYNIKRGG